jgi:hypothetical protein
MNETEIHPEELLERARQGSLARGDEGLLEAHLSGCSACRFELSLAPALYIHLELTPQDDALIARAVAKTGLMRRQERRSPVRRAIPTAATLIAALLVGAAMASAGAYAWRQHSLGKMSQKTPAAAPVASRRSPEALPVAPPPPASRRTDPPATRVAAAQPNRCADRFKRANELRRGASLEQAVRLYQSLRRDCAGTSEELVSRVLIGRIFLDRLSDPARALAAFDSYLTTRSGSTLHEEALIGRALALGRLNRREEEAAAWQALLSAYPDSLYAPHARDRLDRAR